MIKSINVQLNKFGAVEVSAQVEGQKQTIEMLVLANGENDYSVTTSNGFKATRLYGTWDMERATEDKTLRVMFAQAWFIFDANKPEPVQEESTEE